MMPEEFNLRNKLYHYTSLSSLSKIIDSGILKFGKLPNMNDITEASKEYYLDCNPENAKWDNLDLMEAYVRNIRQISLTADGELPGFAINSMWGHYAEAGEGCCIVFDKNKILQECKKHEYLCGNVLYNYPVNQISLPDGVPPKDYIKEKYHELFLHKSPDWKPEQEFRIINIESEIESTPGIHINDATLAVILHTNCNHRVFDCELKQKFIDQLSMHNIPVLEYIYSEMWSCNNKGPMLLDINSFDWLNNNCDYSLET